MLSSLTSDQSSSLEVFDTLMEMGGFATLEASVRCKNPTLDQLRDIMRLAALGMRAKNQARLTRLRERTLAFHERKYQDELDCKNRQKAREEQHRARFGAFFDTLPTRPHSPGSGEKPGGEVLKVTLPPLRTRQPPALQNSTTPLLQYSMTPLPPLLHHSATPILTRRGAILACRFTVPILRF
jgi:hypothetical protein